MENTPKRPNARTDFYQLASDYNLLASGRTLKMPRVSNVTNMKRALERRGIKEREDFDAYNQGKFFFLRKLSEKPMDFQR